MIDIENRSWPLYSPTLKRLFDLLVTIPALLVLAPFLLLLALLVRLKLGAPVLFRQQRPGWHGIPFTLYKFRTMTDARSTSLDELPELFNPAPPRTCTLGAFHF